MNRHTHTLAIDRPLLARAYRHLSRLEAAIQRQRFNARARTLAGKLRAEIELTEAEDAPVLDANPSLTGLAYFLRDYEAAIESACWDEADYFTTPRVTQGMA